MKFSNKTDDLKFDDADEDVEDTPVLRGIHTHITPQGFKKFQDEFNELVRVERPKVVEVVSWAAGNGDRSENGDYIYGKKRLREIDRRIRFLSKRIKHAAIIDPKKQTRQDQVFFGATVTYVNDDDVERQVTIVGMDEADLDAGCVSLASPIARALLKAYVGDVVELRTPGGAVSLEVLSISY